MEASCHKQDSLMHGAASSVSCDQQTPPLIAPAMSVTNLPQSSGTLFTTPDGRTADNTVHAIKRDIGRKKHFFQIPPAFDACINGELFSSEYCHNVWYGTRGQSNLTKSASQGAHSPVRGHPRGSKVVPLNSWGRVSY